MAASESTAEEEVLAEVEAVQAIYGDDCCFLRKIPPYFHVHMKPRTAEISSQQFVELDLGICASPQYPEEPPQFYIVGSKGLDQKRQNDLMASIHNKAQQLSSCSMLIALCEEAMESLSRMNHPEGNCPLCMYPLVGEEDTENNSRPFMKLMSCFHCFHSECIIGWWNWVQKQQMSDVSTTNLSEHIVTKLGIHEKEDRSTANCPVCRKLFHVKDIEHVLDLINANPNQDSYEEDGKEEMENALQSESEKIRRQEFETILNRQEERDGLIKEKRDNVLLSGMFLSQQQRGEEIASVGVEPSSNNTTFSNNPSSSRRRNSHRGGRGRGRGRNPRQQAQIWLPKEK